MVLVTTSWDDGHPDDSRLVDLLSQYGIKATLYVPYGNPERPVMPAEQLARLAQAPGIEIGSHTVSHLPLTRFPRDRIARELTDSKHWLEDCLSHEVTSFCFPQGKHKAWMRDLVTETGYRVGRTTDSHHVGPRVDPLLMPTTLQVYPHRRMTYLRHAVREANLSGIRNLPALGPARDVAHALGRAVRLARLRHGFVHLWGHSWEIADSVGWDGLETLFDALRSLPDARFVTNAELPSALHAERRA